MLYWFELRLWSPCPLPWGPSHSCLSSLGLIPSTYAAFGGWQAEVQSYRNRTFSLVFSVCPEIVGIVTDLLVAKNIWEWKKTSYFDMFLSGSSSSQALWGLDSLSGVRRWWQTECHSCLSSGSALLCLWLEHIHTAKSLHSDLGWLVIHGLWPLPASGKREELRASPVPFIGRPGEPAHCGRWCVCLQIYNLMGSKR